MVKFRSLKVVKNGFYQRMSKHVLKLYHSLYVKWWFSYIWALNYQFLVTNMNYYGFSDYFFTSKWINHKEPLPKRLHHSNKSVHKLEWLSCRVETNLLCLECTKDIQRIFPKPKDFTRTKKGSHVRVMADLAWQSHFVTETWTQFRWAWSSAQWDKLLQMHGQWGKSWLKLICNPKDLQ